MPVPQFGPGRPVRVVDSGGEPQKKFPTWVWYAGGAIVAIIILLFIRGRSSGSSSTTSGTPLSTIPSGDAGQLANLTAAVQAATSGVQGTSSSGYTRSVRGPGENPFYA